MVACAPPAQCEKSHATALRPLQPSEIVLTATVEATIRESHCPPSRRTVMSVVFSRRGLLQLAGAAAGAMLGSRYASAQQPQAPQPAPRPRGIRGFGGNPEPFPPLQTRSTVSLVHGDDRRKNVYEALLAIDDQVKPKLKQKKYVI